MNSIITVKDVSKSFAIGRNQKLSVLHNINLEIAEGEFFMILGPSGSGKSTLLRVLSGLEEEYQGEVRYGEGITRADIGFVFQEFALFPWLTVFENIALGLRARHVPDHEVKKKVERELERFNLTHFSHAFPRELSGGMKQRIGIARALATDPKIIFMDEPFSELDSFTADDLRKEFSRIWSETQQTIIMVTHLVGEAIELSDRIAVFTPRPGKIEKIMRNPLARPRNKRAEEFFRLEDELNVLIRP